MTVLGLDTSTTSTGFAVIENGKLISYGTIEPPKKIDLLDRILYIEEYIKQIIKAKDVDYVVMEQLTVMRSANTTRVLAGMLYHLLLEFRKRDLLTILVRPSEWRGHCHIKGRTRAEVKAGAMKYIIEKYGVDANEDEADAICIAEYGSKIEGEC